MADSSMAQDWERWQAGQGLTPGSFPSGGPTTVAGQNLQNAWYNDWISRNPGGGTSWDSFSPGRPSTPQELVARGLGGARSTPPASAAVTGTGTAGAGLPDYFNNLLNISQGQVSPGTINTLTQYGAERGIRTGMAPGAAATNAATMRALGLTAEEQALKAYGILSPMYQQQVSEAGQTSRLGMSLANQIKIAQMEQTGANQRQSAALASQQAIAQLEQAGMNQRQAAALASELQKLTISNDAQDQRQAQELAAAMDRLVVGNASEMDRARLAAATNVGIQTMQEAGMTQRQQAQIGSAFELAAQNNAAEMARLEEQGAMALERQAAEIAANAALQSQRIGASWQTSLLPYYMGGTGGSSRSGTSATGNITLADYLTFDPSTQSSAWTGGSLQAARERMNQDIQEQEQMALLNRMNVMNNAFGSGSMLGTAGLNYNPTNLQQYMFSPAGSSFYNF